MKSRLLLLVITLLLAGCGSMNHQQQMEQSSQNKAESELNALFSQPYIDPLTRYLETNRNNPARTDELRKVRQERDRRCQVIADNYAKQKVTAQSVERFRRGYTYSCPRAVQAYASQLESKSTISKTAPDSPSITTEQIPAHVQSSDCYLLTSIKNYAEAIRVCEAPAASGDLRAQTNMATIHYELKRYELALKWTKLAAESSAEAAFLLARLYEQGQGVEANPQEALNWYQHAQQLGHTQAGSESLRLSHEIR
jgi:TPR repeat protein